MAPRTAAARSGVMRFGLIVSALRVGFVSVTVTVACAVFDLFVWSRTVTVPVWTPFVLNTCLTARPVAVPPSSKLQW